MTVARHVQWSREWFQTWAQIGWFASTDLLQAQTFRALVEFAGPARAAVRELEREVDNLRVAVEWLRRKTK